MIKQQKMSSTLVVTEHVQHFADTMLGLKAHELEEEHWQYALKQMIAAEVTCCNWAQVCAHVTPGAVEALRFSSMGQIDDYAQNHENSPAFYVALANQAQFPNEQAAQEISPTFSDFWQTVCPLFPVGRAIVAFHAINLNNAREVVLELAKDQGASLMEQRCIGSALDQYQNNTRGNEHAYLATELGQLWTSVGFPAEMFPQETLFASADAVDANAGDDRQQPSDEYSKRILCGTPIFQEQQQQQQQQLLRMHPAVEAYRRAAKLPVTFSLAKTITQLLLPEKCGEQALGPRQTPTSVREAVAKVALTPETRASLVLDTMRIAKNLSVLLETPQARQMYSSLRSKHGAEWIAQNIDAPQLAARLAASSSDDLPLVHVYMSV